MLFVLDNYDSFTYNLVQYLGELGAEPLVIRNDKMTPEEADDLAFERLVVSPGPGAPEDAGYSIRFIERFGPAFDLPPDAALKFRTGGETEDAFPDEARLASALTDALEQDLRFKLTAGLHNAVRHTDPTTGFEHQGFLNVVLAVHAVQSGASDDVAAAILGERDASVVAAAVADLDEAARGHVRSRFLSFGTCSISEPIDDLRELGLLEEAA